METEMDLYFPDSNLQFTRYYSSLPAIDGNWDMGSNWRHNFSAIMEHAAETMGGTTPPAIKSKQAGNPESACLNRWDEIKSHVFLGAFKSANTSFGNGSCLATMPSGESVMIPVYKSFQVKTTLSSPSIVSSRGVVYNFVPTGSGWEEANSAKVSLRQVADEWHFENESNIRHVFLDGVLQQLNYPGGEVVSLTYSEQGKLEQVDSNKGGSLSFNYTDGRLSSIETPSGIIQYLYQDNNLVQVIYQDGTSKHYHYEDTRFPSHLTGITNENGDRYASWAYDPSGRVILSEHGNGVERYEFYYRSHNGTTRVTGPNGDRRIYQVSAQQGGPKVSGIKGDRCQNCPNSQYKDRSYDTNGYLASTTDWNGITTSFVHDDTGLELSRTEAVGTPQERTITTEWDEALRLPVKVTTPTSVTQFTYDANGNLLSRTESAQGFQGEG
jgi:YD repeat-containing protein